MRACLAPCGETPWIGTLAGSSRQRRYGRIEKMNGHITPAERLRDAGRRIEDDWAFSPISRDGAAPLAPFRKGLSDRFG